MTRLSTGRTFSSLRVRNYRLFFYGQTVSVSGTWMQTVAQGWLILDLSHSGTILGLVTAARFAPMMLFAPWGGLVADRRDKRRILYVTQAASGMLAFALAALVFAHLVNVPLVFLIALCLGVVNVFDNPTRQSFIAEMVPSSELGNAVTLNSITINLARVIGPSVAGAVIATLGLGTCFALNGASFAAVLASLALMRGAELFPAPPQARQKGQIREGLRYVGGTPELLIPLIMITVVGTLAWEFQVSLPLMARYVFHGGAGTYGTMLSFMGAGAVLGGIRTARLTDRQAVSLSWSSVGWGGAILAAALMPNLAFEYAVMLLVGYGSISFNSMAKTTLQMAAVPSMRGRVMALWSVAWLGSTPIGGPIVGWVGQSLGARWSLIIGGVPTMAVGLACFRILTAIDRKARERAGTGEIDPAQAEATATLAAPQAAAATEPG